MTNAHTNKSFMHNFRLDTTKPNHLQMFEMFYPIQYTKQAMLPLLAAKVVPPLAYTDFLTWLGLWLLMTTLQGTANREYSSKKAINIF